MLAPTPSPLDELADQLGRLDRAAVADQVDALAGEVETPAELALRYLLPAWEQLDRRCADGDVDPTTSGAAAAIARRALARAARHSAPRLQASGAGALAVVCPPGSADLFGAEVVVELASERGWDVESLGAASAAGELLAFPRAERPRAVVVTAHDPTSLPRLAAVVGAAHAAGAPVLAWGAAFGVDERRARRLGTDAWAASIDVVVSILALWKDRAPTPARGPGLTDSYQEVERLRPSLLAAATRSDAAEDWVVRAAEALVDRLVAAVGLNDPSLLDEHLERERRGLAHSGLPEGQLVGLVDAVAAALPLTSVVAREYVVTSREALQRSVGRGSRSGREAPPTSEGTSAAPDGAQGSTSADAGPQETSAGAPANTVDVVAGPGQAFVDLLLLASLACQAPCAMLSVPQGNGNWSTLSYGFEQRADLSEPRLFELVAAQVEPVEIADLGAHPDLGRTAFALPPHSLRWAYAVALRRGDGTLAGVLGVFDRWLREAGRREHRAMQAVGRQAVALLGQVRKGAAPGSCIRPAEPPPADPLAGLRRGSGLQDGQQLLRSHEVAVLFDVTERTVINWAAAGKLPSLRTIGGHLRFRRDDVLELLAGRSSAGVRR